MSDDQNDRKGVKPWDLFNGSPKSLEAVSEARLDICRGCEHFRQTLMSCRKCGCFMKLKTTLEHAKCPIGKW